MTFSFFFPKKPVEGIDSMFALIDEIKQRGFYDKKALNYECCHIVPKLHVLPVFIESDKNFKHYEQKSLKYRSNE